MDCQDYCSKSRIRVFKILKLKHVKHNNYCVSKLPILKKLYPCSNIFLAGPINVINSMQGIDCDRERAVQITKRQNNAFVLFPV